MYDMHVPTIVSLPLCLHHPALAFNGGSFAAKRAGQRLSVESCSTTSQGRRRTVPGEVRMMSGSLEDEVCCS